MIFRLFFIRSAISEGADRICVFQCPPAKQHHPIAVDWKQLRTISCIFVDWRTEKASWRNKNRKQLKTTFRITLNIFLKTKEEVDGIDYNRYLGFRNSWHKGRPKLESFRNLTLSDHAENLWITCSLHCTTPLESGQSRKGL